MSATASERLPHQWTALLALIRVRVRMLTHPAVKKRAGAGGRNTPFWLRYAAIAIVAEFLVFNITGRLSGAVGGTAGRLLLSPLLTWVSSAASVFVFLFAIPAVLAAYTYNSDLRLLLLTPLSPRLIMVEKFAYIYAQLTVLLLLVGIPILFGVGSSLSLGAGYDVAAVVVLLLLPVAPIALAQFVLTAVLRWVPPRLARTITVIMSTLMAVAFYVGTQLVLNKHSGNQTANLQALFAQSSGAWWQSLPTTWPGRALGATAHGQTASALSYLAATALLAAVLAAVAVLFAAHLFATGWATYQEVGARRRTAAAGERAAHARVVVALPVAETGTAVPGRTGTPKLGEVWRPLWRKEWRSLTRDAQVWARMLYPLVIVLVGLYRTSSPSGASHTASTITFFTTLDISIYVLSASFLALRVVNREGRSLYLLALSPIDARDILLVKWAFCVAPVLVMAEVILAVGVGLLKLALWQTVLSFVVLALLVIALEGMLILVSLIWPRLDWDAPNRQASAQATFAGAFGGLASVGGVIALLVLTLEWAPDHAMWAAAATCGIFVATIGAGAASLLFGVRQMRRLLRGAA